MELTDKIELFNEDNMTGMARYPDKYFDLAIVDPPYGIERFKRTKENTDPNTKDVFANKFLKSEQFNNTKPSNEYWDQLFRVSKNQIIWGANNFQLPTSEYFIIWDKKQSMPNFARCEYAWVSMGLKTPSKIFEYSIHIHNQTDKIHPTQKPVALYKWILEKYAQPNFKILDTHLGSGSIAIAAHKYGCHLTGFEIDTEYYEAAVHRFQMQNNAEYAIAHKVKATGQTDLFLTP